MKIKNYAELMTAEHLMGPNSMRILGELLEKHPLDLNTDSVVLDLGCGKGLTSLLLARETPAKVCAADLWVTAEENRERFVKWGVDAQITAIQADANALPFEKKQFDALVSVDAYHYFAGEMGFFEEKILPFLKDGAAIRIGVPGIKGGGYDGRAEALLSPWLGADAHMFKSPAQWKEILGGGGHIAYADAWEMECFGAAWEDWFATGHAYAAEDRKFYEDIIQPYTCFVGISLELG